MEQATAIHVRGVGCSGVTIGRRGAAWLAKADGASSGVPVTPTGLRTALKGSPASFAGLTQGLTLHWQGPDLRAEFLPLDGPATSLTLDPQSLENAIAEMER